MRLFNDKGESREIETQPFGEGGEGAVYRFAKGDASLRLKVAKVYFDLAHAAARLGKIDHMVTSPATNPGDPASQYLIWPEELLYDDRGTFRGYVMPIVQGAVDLEHLCTPQSCSDPRFVRFDHRQDGAMLRRLLIAMNLAAAINALHRTGSYVIVDLKAQNVQINPQGILALVDMDSLQITDGARLLHPCPVVTEEYAPPEYHRGHARPAAGGVSETWDRFCFAILVYRLLFALHPFAGSYRNSGWMTVMDGIREGCFANGQHRTKFHAIPRPHDAFGQLPHPVQEAFLRCFDDGHARPTERPTMREWYEVLKTATVDHRSTMAHATIAATLPLPQPIRVPRRAAAPPQRRRAPVVVAPPPPPPFQAVTRDLYFVLPNGQRVVIGQQVALNWRVPGATVVRGNFKGSITQFRRLPAYGSETVTIYRTTTFILNVRYSDGTRQRHVIQVPVLAHVLPAHVALGRVTFLRQPQALPVARPLQRWQSLATPNWLTDAAHLASYAQLRRYRSGPGPRASLRQQAPLARLQSLASRRVIGRDHVGNTGEQEHS